MDFSEQSVRVLTVSPSIHRIDWEACDVCPVKFGWLSQPEIISFSLLSQYCNWSPQNKIECEFHNSGVFDEQTI